MLENLLRDKLKRIFDLPRVTFDKPGDSKEQNVAFIDISNAKSTIRDSSHVARVIGQVTVYANGDDLPLGYFNKRLALADPNDLADFFFYDFDETASLMLNLVERKISFVFFFNGQYNPEVSTMSTLTVDVEQVSE